MKKLLFLFLIAASIYSCKDGKKPPTVDAPKKDTTGISVCDFGIDSVDFNTTDRTPEQKAGRGGVKPPRIKNPPPATQPRGVILLDFDGHLVTGTSWNFYGDIQCAESGLTVEEQQKILDTVALRYSQFNVTVTTDEALFNAAPINRRQRCIITTTYEWFGRAGGVAVNGSFTDGSNAPCFVFSILFNFGLKFIQEAATHEIGHTLKLFHQSDWQNGIKVAEYRGGCIMGIGYYVPAPGWIVGTNTYNQNQDDAAVIRAALQ